jgi:hypothetical protein
MCYLSLSGRIVRAGFLFGTLVFAATGVRAQVPGCPPNGPCDPRQFDEYGDLSWENEKARLDNIAIQVQRESPNIVAYFLIYAGRTSCVGAARARGIRIETYLVQKRGLSSRQVAWADAGYREKPLVEVWMWPPNVSGPVGNPSIDKTVVHLKRCGKSRPRSNRRRT